MNSWDRNKFEQLDVWTVSLRPTLLNVLDGSNHLPWAELYLFCRGTSSKLSTQFCRGHQSYVAALLFVGLQNLLRQHVQSANLRERFFVNLDQFRMLWNEYLRKIELIRDILLPAKPIGLHADLIRIFMRQICNFEALEKNDKFRHASLNFRLENLQLGQLYNIEVVQHFIERCGIYLNNGPPTLSDLCVRRICSDLNVDALHIPSIVKQKIYAEREHWPMPPWGIGSRKEITEMDTGMSTSQKSEEKVPKMFYEEFVVVAQNELKFNALEYDVVFAISTELGAFTMALVKTDGHIELRISEFLQGNLGTERFELCAYAYTNDPDKRPDGGGKIRQLYANLPSLNPIVGPDAAAIQRLNGHQLIELNFGNVRPEEPIRNDLNATLPGWLIGMDERDKEHLKHFVFTFRLLKPRSDFTNFKISSPLRDTEIVVNGIKFYVNQQFIICCTSDHNESSQPPNPAPSNFFRSFFAPNNRNRSLNVNSLCLLHLEKIKESALPSSEQIFEDFLLCLTHSVLPNRDNVAELWALALGLTISSNTIKEKCKHTVKLGKDMEHSERAQLAARLEMADSFLNAINYSYAATNSPSKVGQGFGHLIKRRRFNE